MALGQERKIEPRTDLKIRSLLLTSRMQTKAQFSYYYNADEGVAIVLCDLSLFLPLCLSSLQRS